jgi:hypothetical protein
MINEGFSRFGGGSHTLLTPLGLALLLIAAVLILTVRRNTVVVPLLFGSLLIPFSEQVVVADLHFTAIRLLMACAWVRVLFGGRGIRLKLTKVDTMVISWAISGAITFTLLWASTSALVNRMGVLYDCLGIYFLLRSLLSDEASVYRAIRAMCIVAFCLGVCMLAEHLNGTSVFFVFGSAPKISEIRNGVIRAQGPFAHEILAGCLGATLTPLCAGMWWLNKSRLIALLGMIGSVTMTYTSFSSTAFLACGASVAALFMWTMRRYMRVLRWTIVLVLVALEMVMKAPVWALIGRIDLTGGSSGYHRFELVNQTILHFNEWWLIGEKTTYQWGPNMWDTANTYVETAVTGGLCTLVLFVAIIVVCFKDLGRYRKSTDDPEHAKWTWILGCALFAHLIVFIGITYYDQTVVGWYLLIAMISTIESKSVVPRVTDALHSGRATPWPDRSGITAAVAHRELSERQCD